MAQELEMTISDETVSDIQRIIAEYQANTIDEAVIQDKNAKLRAAARKFMDAYDVAEEDIKKYNELQQARAAARKNISPIVTEEKYAEKLRITEETNNYSGKFKSFFDAVMVFNDEILTIIYDKPVETVVIVEGADGQPQVYTFSIQELLDAGGITFVEDYESKSHTLVGRIKLDIDKLVQNEARLKQLDTGLKNFSIIGLNQAYTNAKIDLQTHSTGKTPQAFFKSYYTNDIWNRIVVAGRLGDLSEAYSYFYLTQKLPFNETEWPNLSIFFLRGVANVDSVSGLLATDVETESINYAIKASKASLPGYKQMIKLARDILSDSSKNVDIEKLVRKAYNAQFKNQKGSNSPIRKGLRNTVSEALDYSGWGIPGID